MGWPTDTQIDQAAETLCRMAEIPGLERGKAIFKKNLTGRVEWYSPLWGIYEFASYPVDLEAQVPHGGSYDSRAELFEACKCSIEDALYARQGSILGTLPQWFDLMRERGVPERGVQPDDLRAMADQIEDTMEGDEWRERIDAEWPRLTVVGEDR